MRTPRGNVNAPHPSDIEIRRQVNDICRSPCFAGAERHQQVLNYIVEATLKGKPTTETSIALAVYKADPLTYHPSVNAVARVGKGKLVKRLRNFYASEGGKQAPIEITLDGYDAKFRYTGRSRRDSASRTSGTRTTSMQRPARTSSKGFMSWASFRLRATAMAASRVSANGWKLKRPMKRSSPMITCA